MGSKTTKGENRGETTSCWAGGGGGGGDLGGNCLGQYLVTIEYIHVYKLNFETVFLS